MTLKNHNKCIVQIILISLSTMSKTDLLGQPCISLIQMDSKNMRNQPKGWCKNPPPYAKNFYFVIKEDNIHIEILQN